jgi:hypothetical protein
MTIGAGGILHFPPYQKINFSSKVIIMEVACKICSTYIHLEIDLEVWVRGQTEWSLEIEHIV